MGTPQKKYLSSTQLNMFLRCPRQYEFRYLEGLKIPPSGAMIQGRAWHEALEANYSQKIESDTDIPLDDMQGIFAGFRDVPSVLGFLPPFRPKRQNSRSAASFSP